jgi:hypothetical protein
LWIEGGGQNSFNISDLEVGNSGIAGVYIHNQTPHWTNILFQNFRAEAFDVGMSFVQNMSLTYYTHNLIDLLVLSWPSVKQRLGLQQVRRVEPLGEPVVN